MRRAVLITLTILAVAAGPLAARAGSEGGRIPLPDGFLPEGISVRPNGDFYVGSIPTGAVFKGDVHTGEGSLVVDPTEGRSAIGLKANRGKLFVAGGETGQAYVYDARSGRDIATVQLTREPAFINDVIVTARAAWFTDSVNPVVYRVPLRPSGVPSSGRAQVLALTGDIRYREGFNVNGIEVAPDGKRLVIVQTNTGLLFTVNMKHGNTRRIRLGGKRALGGDGLLLDDRCLYVVQGEENKISVIDLEPGLHRGSLEGQLRDPDLDFPTTLDDLGGRLYVVNARFDTPPTPTTEYWIAVLHKAGCST